MKKTYYILILLTSLTVFFNTQAQDMHFSQYHVSSFSANPAFSGFFDGSYRVIGHRRSQWKSVTVPYVTTNVAVDFHIPFRFDFIGFGGNIMQDQSGDGILRVFKARAHSSFHSQIGGFNYHSIAIGAQFGYIEKSINTGNLLFPNQYDNNMNFDRRLPHGEDFDALSRKYYDLSAGVLWYFLPEDKPRFFAGASFYHLNRPVESFFLSDNKVGIRYHGYFGNQVSLNSSTILTSRILYMQEKIAQQLIVSSEIEYFFVDNVLARTSVFFGTLFRVKDAFVITAGGEHKTIRLGLSYDINISELVPGSRLLGAFEISVIHSGKLRSLYKGQKCPKYF